MRHIGATGNKSSSWWVCVCMFVVRSMSPRKAGCRRKWHVKASRKMGKVVQAELCQFRSWGTKPNFFFFFFLIGLTICETLCMYGGKKWGSEKNDDDTKMSDFVQKKWRRSCKMNKKNVAHSSGDSRGTLSELFVLFANFFDDRTDRSAQLLTRTASNQFFSSYHDRALRIGWWVLAWTQNWDRRSEKKKLSSQDVWKNNFIVLYRIVYVVSREYNCGIVNQKKWKSDRIKNEGSCT